MYSGREKNMAVLGEGGLRAFRTFPKLLACLAASGGNRTAIREKDFGIWQSWTWREYLIEARSLAGGLVECGFQESIQ